MRLLHYAFDNNDFVRALAGDQLSAAMGASFPITPEVVIPPNADAAVVAGLPTMCRSFARLCSVEDPFVCLALDN